MSQQTRIQDVLTRVATEFKSVYNLTGTLTNLTTANKTNLVSAINELNGLVNSSAIINDSATSSTTTVLSASRVSQLIATAKSEILGGASSAFDTLLEIQNALTGDDNDLAALLTAVNNRVRFDAPQSLSGVEQAQALSNIGGVSAASIGNTDTNYVSIFEAALV